MPEATAPKAVSGVEPHWSSASLAESMKPADSSSGVVCALPTTNSPASSTMNVSVIVPPASIASTLGLRSGPAAIAASLLSAAARLRRLRGAVARGRRGGLVKLHEEVLALDPHAGQTAEEARHPPVRLAEQDHHRGHEHATDDGRVDGDCDREAEAELLDDRVAVEDEARVDADHDQRRCRDHAGADSEPVDHRLVVVAGLAEVLLHARQQEHLVVHREAEEDREHEER